MKKQRMREYVGCIAQIKISCIDLPLRAKYRDYRIEISYLINDGRFRFRETMLIRANFKLHIMRNMVINNKFK
jgi:hypothetical protein